MYVADLLSRRFVNRINNSDGTLTDVIHTIIEIQINFTNGKESEFVEKTKCDEVLTKVIKYCKESWS